jgi:uncharacterized protein (DUF1697 family)
MTYVALLRGINVGGKNRVEMAKLKLVFEKLGFENVKTYINSGNIIFKTSSSDKTDLTKKIEAEIENYFGFQVSVLLRNLVDITKLTQAIPPAWVNDQDIKCDVMFLWGDIDNHNILGQLPINSSLEDVKYFPGAVVWRIDRSKLSQSRMLKLIGTDIYKKLTIRNPNTVRKLYELMQI